MVQAKKSFGQNFLIDRAVIERILDAAEISTDDAVIEIGPGRGALTFPMLERGAIVTAVEIERDVVAFLRANAHDAVNLRLVEGDALRIDFREICPEPMKLVANLPYNISTAILQRLIANRECFSQLILMFQREVAERITAQPGTSARGFLSVVAQRRLAAEHLFDVSPQAFRPVPKVTSAICRLVPRYGDLGVRDDLFNAIVSAAFAQRRKTLGNNLKNAARGLFGWETDPIATISNAGIDPKRRAETLTNDEWENLAAVFEQNSQKRGNVDASST